MRFFGWLKRDKGWTLDGEGDSEFRPVEAPDCKHPESRKWSVEGGFQRRCRQCDTPLTDVEEELE